MIETGAPSGADDRGAHAKPVREISRTPHTSEPGGRRISIPVRDVIAHTGGRPRRALTGIICCGRCGMKLRAGVRQRIETRWRPIPGAKINEPYTVRWNQPRYTCPSGHLAILATETEERVSQLVQRRTGRLADDRAAVASAVLRIVVAPGVPGRNHFDPYRLGLVWQPAYARVGAIQAAY